MSRGEKILVTVICVLVGLAMVVVTTLLVIRAAGKRNMRLREEAALAQGAETADTDDFNGQNGRIRYNGYVYEYNDDLINILFMGTGTIGDRSSGISRSTDDLETGVLYLIVSDSRSKEIRIIDINPDLQELEGADDHEDMVDAVSDLMHDIPVHGYCAIDMATLEAMTEVLGGMGASALPRLFGALSDRMITDLTVSEVSYLAAELADYSFDTNHIYGIDGIYIDSQGNTDTAEAEFYADEDALKELILDIFYREVSL